MNLSNLKKNNLDFKGSASEKIKVIKQRGGVAFPPPLPDPFYP